MTSVYSSYQRQRDAFGSVSGNRRVVGGDTGLITLVPGRAQSSVFVQKIHIEVTTASPGELWTFQDAAAIVVVKSASAGAVAHFDFDFGPKGIPLTVGAAFVVNVTGATGAVGWIVWEAYQTLVPVVDYASLILALNPLAYWRFEETGSNILFDSSGNFHHAYGGHTVAPGRDLPGVTFQKPSALRDGTFGIEGRLPTVDGVGIFPVTITASAMVSLTGTITLTWAGIPAAAQSAQNWITITKVGRRQDQYSGWTYITNTGAGTLTIPPNNNGGTPLDPGYYDIRLYYKDNWNLMQQILGQVLITANASGGLMVSSPSPAPLVLGPTCTFECGFTLHSNPPNYGFICGDNSAGLYLYNVGGVYSVNLNYSGSNHLSTPFAIETRYYLTVVCNAGAVTFFLNGQPWGTAAGWPGITIVNLLNVFPTAVTPLIADLDELVLYGTALDLNTIAAHAARWA